MSTSRPHPRPAPRWWRLALEAGALATVSGFLPGLALVPMQPHPGWIAALVLSARHGSGGFLAGLVVVAAAIALESAVAGIRPAEAWTKLATGPDLAAFGASLLVSWVAAWHLRRHEELDRRARALRERLAASETANEVLREVAATLRARVDRASTSLAFLRDVAGPLEGTDPVAAARAAADLALVRTGAAAAMVQVGVGGEVRTLALRDSRGPGATAPLELREADLTVPIRNGTPVGRLVLWGLPRPRPDEATANDLHIIASWCLPAVSIAAWRHAEHAREQPVG